MKCPIDNVDLVMSDRQGIEIDYCPQCRGVWLDRGELDKIIERTPGSSSQTSNDYPQEQPRQYDEGRKHDDYRQKKHKKEGFLGDLFDF